jgi:uncharacterized protein
MRRKRIVIFSVILVLLVAIVAAGAALYQYGDLPLMARADVVVNGKTFHVEVALSRQDQHQGLSGRATLAQDQGMLFVFSQPGYYVFWMPDMHFPLDMIYIYRNKIAAIFQDVPPKKPNMNGPLYGGEVLADRVLEINAGLSQKYVFHKGDSIETKLYSG